MKRNYLILLAITMVAICSFVSCSDDDNDDSVDNPIGTSILYIDNQKMNTDSPSGKMLSSIQYDGKITTFPIPEFALVVAWDTEESAAMIFQGIELEALKVGDDIAKLCNGFDLLFTYKGNEHWLVSNIDDYNDIHDWRGQFIVKEINADKTMIRVDFDNVKIPMLNSSLKPIKTKFISVKGSMKYKIDF